MRILLLFLGLLFASPAFATQDRWPAMFDVTDVAEDDVLNLREGPSPDDRIVGSLAPDATGIEVLRPNASETWGLVNTGEQTAWVALRYLRRQPGQFYGAVPDKLVCAGTEPFWRLSLTQQSFAYQEPTQTAVAGRIDSVEQSQNHPGRHAFTGIFPRTADAHYMDFVALLANEACADGMSDRAYGYRLDLLLGNIEGFTLKTGCCTLTP